MLKLDHVIHYIDGLDEFEFPDKRFILHEGGRHNALGTYNYLAYLSNVYVEFIDVFDDDLLYEAAHDEVNRLSFAATLYHTNFSPGFKRLCFSVEGIEGFNQWLKEKGVKTSGPLKMQREKPNGEIVSWQLLYIDEAYPFEIPFFIEWDNPKNREAEIEPLRQQHSELLSIDIETVDKQSFFQFYTEVLGFTNEKDRLTYPGVPDLRVMEGETERINRIIIDDRSTALHETHVVHGAVYKMN